MSTNILEQLQFRAERSMRRTLLMPHPTLSGREKRD
jgi:hypothetical protein